MMRHLTIRNVPDELARALEDEKRHTGRSLNQTVIDTLERSLGVGRSARRQNGLGSMGGTWSQDDLEEFERATAIFGQIDEDLWR